MSGANEAADFSAEVLRINERYTVEVVEALGTCPFARPARHGGEVARAVVLERDEARARRATLDELHRLAGDHPEISIVLVIHPLMNLSPRAWDDWVQKLREGEDAGRGARAEFVAAPFHPGYPLDARTPERAVPFFRRSPDPLVQWVRLSVLDAVRGRHHDTFHFDYSPSAWKELERRLGTRSVTERITADNHALLDGGGASGIGREEIERRYADIAADRARSYARFPLWRERGGEAARHV